MTVIKPEMNQFAPATAPTTFGELMETYDYVRGTSQCGMEHQKPNGAT
jgi:hypothetical protein